MDSDDEIIVSATVLPKPAVIGKVSTKEMEEASESSVKAVRSPIKKNGSKNMGNGSAQQEKESTPKSPARRKLNFPQDLLAPEETDAILMNNISSKITWKVATPLDKRRLDSKGIAEITSSEDAVKKKMEDLYKNKKKCLGEHDVPWTCWNDEQVELFISIVV
jgi:hypothetical protein